MCNLVSVLVLSTLELPVTRAISTEHLSSPVPKVRQNPMFFVLLELALSEKQTPQLTENTEKWK